MEERQSSLLAEIIRQYIQDAIPVGSKAIGDRFGVSSATIRSGMAELEDLGYLYQPYTSAGRVPTIKGYRYYIDNFIKVKDPQSVEKKSLQDLLKEFKDEQELMVKSLAKKLAHYSAAAAVVGFSPCDVYYTGLSNLFYQPEFSHISMVRSIGEVIDNLDEGMSLLYNECGDEVEVRLGNTNPFGDDCAMVITSLNLGATLAIIGLLGPLRMDYDSNLGRLNYVKRLFVK